MSTPLPLVQLTFYAHAVLCTRYSATGQATYPVAPQDIAEAVADVPLHTGWLAPGTLFYERRRGATTLALHVPQGRHRVQVETEAGVQTWTVPMPDLIFVGRGRRYSVYATKGVPTSPQMELFHAPCPNVYDGGGICHGNTAFPDAAPETIQDAFALFMHRSTFNLHLSQKRVTGKAAANVLSLWQSLSAHPRRRFPLARLRPLHTTAARLLL